MKKTNFLLVSLITFLTLSCTDSPQRLYNEGITVTPVPLELVQGTGSFSLSSDVVFVSENEDSDKIAAYFAAKIKQATGYDLSIQKENALSNCIHLSIAPDVSVNEEGYLLEVSETGVNIQAKTHRGLFYGMQTLMQLLPAEIESPEVVSNIEWKMPVVQIRDEPRYKYRGWLLDVSRHFFDVDFIKKQLDVLAMFKINTFHWHLTDDQGWRIEIKKYPELTEIGAVRTEGEGRQYGPYFYTQEQIKEVVAYAKERFIEVIPEIDLPGHTVAALAAYPQLSCTGAPLEVRNAWGVAQDIFCAGNEDGFQLLEDVITEVIPLFESDYFHIGGDEAPKFKWETCPKCQARIRQENLKADEDHTAEEKLQSYFIKRMEKVLIKHGKKMIGWDETLEGGLAPSATVMSWRGEAGGIIAANMGHDVIMTPAAWTYVDRYQGDPKILPVTNGGYLNVYTLLPLSKVYGYDPMPKEIAKDKEHHVLGAQISTWTEYKYKPEDVEHDMYPRVIALSEVVWSAPANKDYNDFLHRVENQRVRLDMHNINYYIPLPQQQGTPSCNFIAFTDAVTLAFETTEPAKIVYTTNGHEPKQNSSEYVEPLTFSKSTTLKIRSVLLSGKMSPVRTIQIEKQSFAPATERADDATPGLKAEYFKGQVRWMNDLLGKIPDEIEQIDTPQNAKSSLKNRPKMNEDNFKSAVLTGYINIPEDDVYYFSTDAELWINDRLFISNEADNNGTARLFSRSDKSIALAKGYHLVKIVALGGTFGGFAAQWRPVELSIRRASEPEFKLTDATWFQ